MFVASLSAALSAAALLVGGVLVGALASGSANSCLNTAYSLTVQQSMSYNPDTVVAPNSRRKVRPSPTIATGSAQLTERICRQPRLLEHILGQSALCMTSDRSLRIVWHEVPERVQVQVLVLVVGLVWLWGFWAAFSGIFFAVCAAISGFGAGMWYWEVGS